MMGATTAAAGVAGTRAWLAAKSFQWTTARRLRLASISLVVMGSVVAAAGFNGS
jgi:hypothetical protein